jgi:hypothetical protein
VRLVELTAKGRTLITKTFREHAAAMEEHAGPLSKEERLTLLRLFKKLGKGGEDESLGERRAGSRRQGRPEDPDVVKRGGWSSTRT